MTEASPSPILTYRHLTVGDRHRVWYITYPLDLSPTEVRILRVLVARALEDPRGHITAAALAEAVGLPRGQLAVHIHRINQKAATWGGRRLILCHRGMGHRINPYM